MDNKEKNFMSAVIYVHNSGKSIREFLEVIIEALEDNFEHSEIICVNDCSSDESISIIKAVSKKAATTSISVLNMSYFHGLEIAMGAGIDLAIGDFVFEFDSTELDFSKDEIMNVYRKSIEGYDIVSASANKKEKFSSYLFYKIFDYFGDSVSASDYKMSTERFRILSRRAINRIGSMNKMIPYRKAVYVNCGLKMTNIKYTVDFLVGEKLDKKEKKYRSGLAVDALILFTGIGYRLSLGMTLIMMVMSTSALIYSIVIYVAARPVEGWTTTILFLSVSFFGLFGVLTIVAKYMQLLIELVFKRKYYSFESIEKLTK